LYEQYNVNLQNFDNNTSFVSSLAKLESIQDNYEKIILTMDNSINKDYNGIKVKNIIDFLLEEN